MQMTQNFFHAVARGATEALGFRLQRKSSEFDGLTDDERRLVVGLIERKLGVVACW